MDIPAEEVSDLDHWVEQQIFEVEHDQVAVVSGVNILEDVVNEEVNRLDSVQLNASLNRPHEV